MIGPFGRQGAAVTLRQHCPQMTRRRCMVVALITSLIVAPRPAHAKVVTALAQGNLTIVWAARRDMFAGARVAHVAFFAHAARFIDSRILPCPVRRTAPRNTPVLSGCMADIAEVNKEAVEI